MLDVPIQVKDALREGRLRKNYRFQVLNDDGTVDFEIDNRNLVSESVNIDERMVSGDTIKYGLCEGSSLEFQYFGKPNITGKRIKAFVEVNCSEGDYTNVGQFEVMETITITDPGNYRIYSADENAYDYVWVNRDGTYTKYSPMSSANGTEVVFYDLQEGDVLEVEWSGFIYDTFLQKGDWHPISMGYFTVKNCSRQASTGIIKTVGYNKLQSDYLDQKANQMLLDDFEGDPSVELTMYDIQKHLLENYAIIEAPKESIDMTGIPTALGVGFSRNNYNFLTPGGINTPLSLYEWLRISPIFWNETTVSDLGFAIDYVAKTVTIPADSYWGITILNGVETLVENVKTYVVDLIDEAQLTMNGTRMTREQIVSQLSELTFARINIRHNGSQYKSYPMTQEAVDEINDLIRRDDAEVEFILPKKFGFGNFSEFKFYLPVDFVDTYEYRYYNWITPSYIQLVASDIQTRTPHILDGSGNAYTGRVEDYCEVNLFQLSDAEKTTFTIADIPEFTLREIMTASYETVCQFGQLDRETDLFSGVELNRSRLLPADTLYPDNALYPGGAQESAFRSQYSKLWADEGNVHKWKYLIITYKGLDEEQNEKDFTLQRTVNEDGTDNYNMSDNWLFRNLVWTAEQVGEYADAMVAKMQDTTWFPFEMWCAGLPYLETGDEIEIPLGEETYTSYILQRQLKGIQNLQDTYINGTLDIF